MKRSKTPKAYDKWLSQFEIEITHSIAEELKRINRPVTMKEITDNPFIEAIAIFIDAIRLDEYGDAVCDTSLEDLPEKWLISFFNDNELPHRNAVNLFKKLKQIR